MRYRLPSEHWGDGNRVALQDALRALQLVKAQATGLTVLGFSAGAHLLGMAISPMGARMGAVTEAQDSAPVQVDGAALIYPVITLEAPYTHTSTHRILLGAHPTAAEEAAWSVQNTVTAASPPFFFWCRPKMTRYPIPQHADHGASLSATSRKCGDDPLPNRRARFWYGETRHTHHGLACALSTLAAKPLAGYSDGSVIE